MSRRKMLFMAASVIAVLSVISVIYVQGRGNEAQADDPVFNAAFDLFYLLVGAAVRAYSPRLGLI